MDARGMPGKRGHHRIGSPANRQPGNEGDVKKSKVFRSAPPMRSRLGFSANLRRLLSVSLLKAEGRQNYLMEKVFCRYEWKFFECE